jgi:outer membrane lipoprotein-sorting protein
MTTALAMRKTAFKRKLLSNLALAFAITSTAAHTARGSAAPAQAAPAATQDISATWQGTLHAGQDLRIVVKISKSDDGGYKADFYSIDQGGQHLPVDKSTLDGDTVKMSVKVISGSYEGRLSADGKTITGNWTQGPNPVALTNTACSSSRLATS